MACPLPILSPVHRKVGSLGSRIRLSIARSASNPHRSEPRRELLWPVLLAGLTTPAAAAAGVVLRSAPEVLADWTVREDGRLYFQGPDGVRWELVTSVDDPVIQYRGGGAFFPVEVEQVESALAAMDPRMDPGDIEIFVLPFPRRDLLDSNSEGLTVILSPGVWPLTLGQVHMVVAHEVGHCVQQALLLDADRAGWDAYRRLRDIEDTAVYFAGAVHRNRPHEIFAEDFRVLFGGSLAAGSGRVENSDLAQPSEVPELREFFLGLPARRGNTPAPGGLVSSPNPTPAGARITLSDPSSMSPNEPARVVVLDLQGRRVAALDLDGQGQVRWDGRLPDGSPASPGVYFLHAVQGSRRWGGKLLIAR